MIIILFEDIENKGTARDNPSPPEKPNAERSAPWFAHFSAWFSAAIGINRSGAEIEPAEENIEENIS